jgi:hypothetical protein
VACIKYPVSILQSLHSNNCFEKVNKKLFASYTAVWPTVVNLRWCDSELGQPNATSLTNILFNGPNNLQSFFTKGSTGLMVLNPSTVVVREVMLPCTSALSDQCDMWAADAALDEVLQSPGEQEPDNVKYRVKILLPPSTEACLARFASDGVAGYAYGNTTVISPSYMDSLAIWKHEISETRARG